MTGFEEELLAIYREDDDDQATYDRIKEGSLPYIRMSGEEKKDILWPIRRGVLATYLDEQTRDGTFSGVEVVSTSYTGHEERGRNKECNILVLSSYTRTVLDVRFLTLRYLTTTDR